MSHTLLMTLHAVLVGVFFAFLTREDRRGRTSAFLKVSGGMMAGALVLAWLMYFYPKQGVP